MADKACSGGLGGFAEGKNDLFTNPTLAEIGDAYGKSVARSSTAGSSSATS